MTKKKKKILFVGIHRPKRSPSQRYRFEQFQPYLEEQGFEIEYLYIIREQDDKAFYGAGNYLAKIGIVLRGFLKLFFKALKTKKYDIVFVQREAYMLGTVMIEKMMAKRSKVVYDFDDAIWVHMVSEGNRALSFLKDASKTKKLIALSHLVYAGNSYLQDYGLQFNKNTQLIPTVVDSDKYSPVERAPKDKICIGWSGSFSTVPYFELAVPALLSIKEKYGDKVYFKLIGDENYEHSELGIKGVRWTEATEVAELEEIDIGIMPLPNDDWTKGKCALKALLYMSLEQAAVISNVGVNSEVIQDGKDGFLVNNDEEWVTKLSLLIEDKALRTQMGKAGRQTVLERYSVHAQKGPFVEYINALLED